jgi:polyketide cyclase/dehydrase/lipid transport protein
MALKGSVTRTLAIEPAAAFALVTDIERLSEWNAVITRVVERPDALTNGAEWVVELSAMGSSWNSRSRVTDHDADAGRFAYRSQTDDGNPSYGDWTWQVVEARTGCQVTVTWDLNPQTFWRRVLLARIRNQALKKETRASLESLERAARANH